MGGAKAEEIGGEREGDFTDNCIICTCLMPAKKSGLNPTNRLVVI
jgi:hypothetical protein